MAVAARSPRRPPGAGCSLVPVASALDPDERPALGGSLDRLRRPSADCGLRVLKTCVLVARAITLADSGIWPLGVLAGDENTRIQQSKHEYHHFGYVLCCGPPPAHGQMDRSLMPIEHHLCIVPVREIGTR